MRDGDQPCTLIRRHRRGRPCGLGGARRRDTARAARVLQLQPIGTCLTLGREK